ncbi:hypothetical protein ZWY2020_007761 [Hordeum vulgare]|nr:hypothetical protein ZWY2020_007761 [Hordeum vulgare]
MESVDSHSPRRHAQHQQNAREPKDHKSTSKRQSHSTEIPCSLVQEVQHLEKRLNDQFAMRRALEKALGHKPCAIHLSKDCYLPKPTEKLIKEIAVLELEVICLEQHLLTLYRQAFDQQLCSTISAYDMERRNRQSARSFSGTLSETSAHDFSTPKKHQLVQSSRMVQARRSTTAALHCEPGIPQHNDSKTAIGRSHSSLLPRSICSARVSPSANNLARALKPCHTSPLTFVEEGKCMDSSIVSLADILGTRIADHVPQTPNKISEDMIKCIAGIYMRLRDMQERELYRGMAGQFIQFRKESFIEAWQDSSFSSGDLGQQCDSVIEVSALCKGAQRSADVKDMLCKYKSLVQLLETVDLGGMKNEEKLAFWINVHNAMMMHAHIEYGIPQSNSKRMLLTKVSYIISGQRVNAELIEYQILCCRVHSSGQWFRLLLYPRWKPRDKDDLQGFAVDRPEPLVHFALSSGSHSDPVVRLYSPRRLLQQLEAAKEEFIRGNVGVRGSGRSRVILPKVLESYARDAGLAAQELLRVVESCHPGGLPAAVRPPGGARGGGGGAWRPPHLGFRYALARELVGSPAGVQQAVAPSVA